MGEVEDRRVLVGVNRQDHIGAFDPDAVLNGAGYPGRDIKLGTNGLAGLADLTVGADPAFLHQRPRAAIFGAEHRSELAQDAYGKVIGVRTDRHDGEVHADVVVLAEGVNGLLGTRADLRARPKPDNVALAVKEMHFLPRETIEARFNLKGDEGTCLLYTSRCV